MNHPKPWKTEWKVAAVDPAMYKVRMKKKHWNFPHQIVSKILKLPCFFLANLVLEVVVVSTWCATYVDYLDKSWEAWPMTDMKAQDGRWNAMNLICILRCSMFYAFYVSWFVVFFSTEIFKIVASWGLNKYINDIDMQRQSGRLDAVAGSEFCRVPLESFQIHIGTLTH